MTPRQAIKVLMLSPIYFMLDVPARRKLVREFCALYGGEPVNLSFAKEGE